MISSNTFTVAAYGSRPATVTEVSRRDPSPRTARDGGRQAGPDGWAHSAADEPTRAVVIPRGPGTVRNRLVPRTVLGLAAIVLAAAIGSAFSGVVLYSYYEYRLAKTTDKFNAFVATYKKEFDNARADLAAQRAAAKAEIDQQLGPLRQLQASGDTLQALVKKVAPSMFFVHTLDANGQASVGTAFVVASDATHSLLLTSYTTVLAATRKPAPDLFVRQNGVETKTTVWTWDERFDLALIVLPKGNLPHLDPAPTSPAPAIGDRLFAVSGLGSLGGSAVQGVVTDVSADALQHTAPIGQAYQGGPLVNSAGQVVAVASRGYAPLNFTSDGVWFAPFIHSACDKVLTCTGGALTGYPAQRTG
jgi:S1-C subfamily serine protease